MVGSTWYLSCILAAAEAVWLPSRAELASWLVVLVGEVGESGPSSTLAESVALYRRAFSLECDVDARILARGGWGDASPAECLDELRERFSRDWQAA